MRVWPVIDNAPSATEDGPFTMLRSGAAMANRYRLVLALWVALCVVAAVAIAWSIPPTYSAASAILLEPRRPAAMIGREVAPPPVLDLNRADTELQVIRSERLLRHVFDNLRLADSADLAPRPAGLVRRAVDGGVSMARRLIGLGGASAPSADAAPVADDPAHRAAFAEFTRRVGARRIGQSFVVEVSYLSGDPLLVAKVANATAAAYLMQSVTTKIDGARGTAEWVQGRIDALNAQSNAAALAVREGALPAGSMPDADARVIGAALVPLAPVAPRSGLIVALGGVVGLTTGLCLLIFAGALDRRIRTAGDLANRTGLPCLGTVPVARTRSWFTRMIKAQTDNLVVLRPDDGFALAVTNLRSAIRLAMPASQGSGHAVVALVGWSREVGCSLLSMNLARLSQRMGRDVMVIDADVRGAKTTVMEADSLGFSSLVGVLSLRTPESQIVFHDLDGVVHLPAWNPVDGPALVDFDSEAVMRLIRHGRARGDVLLDLPPLGESTDAAVLARRADAVLLVIAVGQTTVDDVEAALRVLRAAGANVIGAVLNKARPEDQSM
ncbi:hypothetical protein [Phreatobacter sp.]|uniref:hypothetical protein n=1 Tax=Phreatobacter sp. TaxID=1966341 RepID=UPI003F6E7595